MPLIEATPSTCMDLVAEYTPARHCNAGTLYARNASMPRHVEGAESQEVTGVLCNTSKLLDGIIILWKSGSTIVTANRCSTVAFVIPSLPNRLLSRMLTRSTIV